MIAFYKEIETKVFSIKKEERISRNWQKTQTLVFAVDCYLLDTSQIFGSVYK